MNERKRFTTGKYDHHAGGYPVLDRGQRLAVFVDQGMAIQYTRMLRAYPQIANSCETCRTFQEAAVDDPA